MSPVGIIDYGMGNLHSVHKALQTVGAEVELIREPHQLQDYERLVLPGVGAFGDAMANLREAGMAEAIPAAIERGTPLLGICLGMQVLFSESEELGHHTGLGILRGSVRFLRVARKVPHMGWNQILIRQHSPLFENLHNGVFVYFANSYVVVPDDPSVIAGETEYDLTFASVVWRDRVYGVQFHPEKSQRAGLQILRNFVERC